MSDDKHLDVLYIAKRSGEVVPFDRDRIKTAIEKATQACGECKGDQAVLDSIVEEVENEVRKRFSDELVPNVENIQDIVEKHLMQQQLFEIAKSYILYRADRQKNRDLERKKKSFLKTLTVKKRNGRKALFNQTKLRASIDRCCEKRKDVAEAVFDEVTKNLFDGMPSEQIDKALYMAASALIEQDPIYSQVAANFFMQSLRRQVFGQSVEGKAINAHYAEAFVNGIHEGCNHDLFDRRLLEYDLDALAEHLKPERDHLLQYMGMTTLNERYLMKHQDKRLELPQTFWMRVAMGLALGESPQTRQKWAIEFYEILSTLRVVSSTPTLFHSGTPHPQLSSCYLLTVPDDLRQIFKYFGDHAQLSKWSGGIGTDWTPVRGTGSFIHTTKVDSQGAIPFIKIASDTTAAINRSGKRHGAACIYLETWHLDIEDFLDLRKNTGDERRRAHDLNTANWIPDLFMQRVMEGGEWTLFSSDEAPDLHELYGSKFKQRYEYYEDQARKGNMKLHKTLDAKKLWRRMLTNLFETGNGWITFKDACNVRSPQDHVGVVHSSNLCTEITLNTSADETAVCNLASVNLHRHLNKDGSLDKKRLQKSVEVAVRMLDNVIDLNFYPIPEAANSNFRHRPIGLGVMGLQDALFAQRLPFDSEEAVLFSDESQEFIAYHAILESSRLAKERGAYETYKGSKWDRGYLPIDTLKSLEVERGESITIAGRPIDAVDKYMPWEQVLEHIHNHGMRNSNVMAIAPTATISTIAGCFPCIEPIYKNIYVKSNMSGEFAVINSYLVADLKKHKLWNQQMIDDLKYHDGNIQMIDRIPADLKRLYRETFDIDTIWFIKHAAARTKWIDQSQSVNIFMAKPSGKSLHDTYIAAYQYGLKTTYYLRTLGASQAEKATLDVKYGYTQTRNSKKSEPEPTDTKIQFCRLDDPTCESCQ